ncbi:hypothetical protein N8016_02875 [Pelagibacteraceae bacterium]|nr:hypothetical protein [Pelagibacteraceae bacterium]
MLFAWYDIESDSGACGKASILSISGVLSNDNFQILDEFTYLSKPRKSRPLEVDAMLVNGLDVEDLLKQDSYGVMLKKLVDKFTDWKSKGAIFVGFNNTNYDSVLINNSLFVNLMYPYLINTGEQFDLLPAVRSAQVFSPNSITYELNDKNLPIFKLASVCKANNIKTDSHTSYGDTLSTLELGKLLAKRTPEVFKASLALRRKSDVKPKLESTPIFCWMEAWRVAKIYCGTHLGEGIFPGWHLAVDLRKNPEEIMNVLNDTVALRKELDASPKWLRTIKANRAPLLMDKKSALLDDTYKNIGMKELEKRQKIINKNKEEILNRIKLIQQSKFDEKNDHDQRELLPEQMIYKLNPMEEQKVKDAFNLADSTQEKKKLFNMFKRDEIKTLAEMIIYEEHNEEEFIKILSKKDYKKIKKRIAKIILNPDGDASVFTNIPQQFARLDTLKVQAENDEDNEKMKQLEKLDKYLINMQADYERYV